MNISSANLLVREAMADDVEAATAVFDAAFTPIRKIYRPSETAVACQGDSPWETIRLVALLDQQIVGTVECDLHQQQLNVIGLAVDPKFQRRGIARL